MKNLALSLLVLVGSAHADERIENMVRNCEQAMQSGACRVALDPKDYPNKFIRFGGIGLVSTEEYFKLRAIGETKNPDGTYMMCSSIRAICKAGWDSEACKARRANWRQQ